MCAVAVGVQVAVIAITTQIVLDGEDGTGLVFGDGVLQDSIDGEVTGGLGFTLTDNTAQLVALQGATHA